MPKNVDAEPWEFQSQIQVFPPKLVGPGHDLQHQDVVLVLRVVRAATQLVLAVPEGVVQLRSSSRHL